ncbi:MAG: hypothetical protein ACTSRW_05995 [Candidatus Helarchaeota archaeon]
MKEKNATKKPVSLSAIFFLATIFVGGTLGIITLTQMEIVDGWYYDLGQWGTDFHELGFYLQDSSYFLSIVRDDYYFKNADDRSEFTSSGMVMCINSLTGIPIWSRVTPNNRTYYGKPLYDCNGDGFPEFLTAYGNIASTLIQKNGNDKEYYVNFTSFYASILDGATGRPFTLNDTITGTDSLLLTEIVSAVPLASKNLDVNPVLGIYHKNNTSTIDMGASFTSNLSAFFRNGSLAWQVPSIELNNEILSIQSPDHSDINNVLVFTQSGNVSIYDGRNGSILASKSYGSNVTFGLPIQLNDVTGDGVGEFGFVIYERLSPQPYSIMAYFTMFDGVNYSSILNHTLFTDSNIEDAQLHSLKVEQDPLGNRIMIIAEYHNRWRGLHILSYSLSSITTLYQRWIRIDDDQSNDTLSATFCRDITNDGYSEICIYWMEPSLMNTIDTKTLTLIDGKDFTTTYWNLRGSLQFSSIYQISNKILGDGRDDVRAYSDLGPSPLSLAFNVPLVGIPSFILLIVCIALLIVAFIYIILGVVKKRFKPIEKKNVKKDVKKFSFFIIAATIIIILMIIVVILMANMLGFFDTTLLLGEMNSMLVMSILALFIFWFTSIPLITAVYNYSAPFFASFLARLNKLYYRILYRKSRKHDIIIMNTEDKEELGFFQVWSRLLLPMFMSIFAGLFVYTSTPHQVTLLEGSQSNLFFFDFFMLLLFPTIIAPFIISFFIPSTWLLEDAGVVYYEIPIKQHLPSDISSISGWAQNWLKGLVGVGTLVTYVTFLIQISFVNPAQEGQGVLEFFLFQPEGMSPFIGLFLLIFVIYGFPFFTAMGLLFLAIFVMELNIDDNRRKLYKRLEKMGVSMKKYSLDDMLKLAETQVQQKSTKSNGVN